MGFNQEKVSGYLDTLNDDELIYTYRQVARKKCMTDLYFLSKRVLDFTDLTAKFHKPLCNQIQAVNPYVVNRYNLKSIPVSVLQRLWLWARGHFKTTIIDIAHTIQLLLIDPNLRILNANNKLDSAKETLLVIKNQFMYNEKFRLLFPEYCPKATEEGKVDWGTSVSITLPNRTNLGLKEGSVECAGVDTGLISRHYDYMKKDDLVTDKSVTTDEQIQASINWDRLSISLFEIPEKGFTDWSGSRYDYRDLYGHLLKRPGISRSIVGSGYSQGKPVFPQRFSIGGLEKIKSDQGSRIFFAQYELQPISPEEQVFRDEWIEKCTYKKFPSTYAISILVDPASRVKKRSDFTGVIVHAIGPKRKWHVVDGAFDKLNAPQRCKLVFKLAKKWRTHLRYVSYETIGFQETDKVMLERMMREKNYFFHIEPVNSQPVSKISRITGLSPLYEHQAILLPEKLMYFSTYENREIDLVEKLKYMLARFPQCEYMDLLDAQAQQLTISKVLPLRRKKKDQGTKPGTFDWYRKLAIDYNKCRNWELEGEGIVIGEKHGEEKLTGRRERK